MEQTAEVDEDRIDEWLWCYDGDLWEEDMRRQGWAVSGESSWIAEILCESRWGWKPQWKTVVPSRLWDAGTPSCVVWKGQK